jgi:hypothetical protein
MEYVLVLDGGAPSARFNSQRGRFGGAIGDGPPAFFSIACTEVDSSHSHLLRARANSEGAAVFWVPYSHVVGTLRVQPALPPPWASPPTNRIALPPSVRVVGARLLCGRDGREEATRSPPAPWDSPETSYKGPRTRELRSRHRRVARMRATRSRWYLHQLGTPKSGQIAKWMRRRLSYGRYAGICGDRRLGW